MIQFHSGPEHANQVIHSTGKYRDRFLGHFASLKFGRQIFCQRLPKVGFLVRDIQREDAGALGDLLFSCSRDPLVGEDFMHMTQALACFVTRASSLISDSVFVNR